MKNKTFVEFIKEKFYEQKMSAEYELQLTKIVELKNKFTKDFSKDKCRENFNLHLAVAELYPLKLSKKLSLIQVLYL